MSEKLCYCFDGYRLDAQTRVLYRGENIVRVEPKIVDMLLFMIQRQGSVVSKDELMKHIWAGTIVEESAIRRNISLMRSMLDPNNNDRYIETLPRQGYRFKAMVTQQTTCTDQSAHAEIDDLAVETKAEAPEQAISINSPSNQAMPPINKARNRRKIWLSVALAMILLVVVASWFLLYPKPYLPIVASRQLTTNSENLPIVISALSPDSSMIAFADETTFFVGDTRTVERHALALPNAELPRNVEWFDDSLHLMVSAINPETHQFTVWRVPVLGGPPELLIRDGRMAVPSADGKRMLFIRNDNQLWIANSDGSNPELFMTAPTNYSFGERPQFSQDGQYVLYSLFTVNSTQARIEARDVKTNSIANLYESPQRILDFRLLNNHELLVSQQVSRGSNASQLFTTNVYLRSGFHSVHRVLATSSNELYTRISAARDGRSLLLLVNQRYSTVQIGTLNHDGTALTNIKRLTMNDSHNLPSSWMPDSHGVLYFSNRTGHYSIFLQDLDSTDAKVLVSDEHDYIRPVVSFDRKRLFYFMPEDASRMSSNMKMTMLRQSLNGDAAQPPSQIIDTQSDFYRSLRCATRVNKCVMTEHDGQSALFYEYDPANGKGHELARVKWASQLTAFYWDLSFDGSHIAYLDTARGDTDITILDVAVSPVTQKELHIDGYDAFATLYWNANATGFYISSYNSNGDLLKLLHVDISGKTDVIRQQMGAQLSWGIPSPDGQYLMFQKFATKSNIWLMQR